MVTQIFLTFAAESIRKDYVKKDYYNIFTHIYTDLYASVAEYCISTHLAQRCGDARQDRLDQLYPISIRSSGKGVAHI